MSTASRSKRVLNIASAMPPRSFLRVPCSHGLLRHLATEIGEKCGLSFDLGISDHVTILGVMVNHDLPKYLRMADLYVFSSYFDGTSQSLLEAMACGRAVVASVLSANREWIQNNSNGLIFPCGDFNHLSS